MAGSYAVRITADDRVTSTLDSINKRFAAFNKEVAKSREPFEKLSRNYANFTKLTGVDKISGGLQAVGRAGMSAFQSVVRIVEPLGVIAGAASVAGMYRLATAWATFGSQLGNVAARAGLSAAQLHTLENAGRLAGVSAEAMSGGMTALRDNMVRAAGGQAPQVIGMLQALGLSASDARRYAADTTKALPELADKIAALRDPTLQAQAATTLFGGAGEQMLPFLRRGSAGIAEYSEKVRRYGVQNAESVDAANRLRQAQSELTLAVEGLGNSIAQRLAPVIGPVLTQMADWIAANRDWIAQEIGQKVQAFAGFLREVDWAKLGTDIVAVMRAAGAVVEKLGGWVPVGTVILGFFAATFLAKMMLPLLTISRLLFKLPVDAAVAATKAEGELAKVGSGPRAPGGRALGLGLGLAGIAADLSGGKTEQEQKEFNTESPLAKAGGALGGALGMKFDENGNSKGLLEKWFGPSPMWSNTPNRMFAPGGSNGPAPPPSQGAAGAVDNASRHLEERPGQVNAFLRENGSGLDATVSSWCAAFTNSALKSAGIDGSGSNVATSFKNWGSGIDPTASAKGDVLLQSNGRAAGQTGGHVGMATGERRMKDGRMQLQMLSGNYAGKVSHSWEDADKLDVRRAPPTPSGPDRSLPANAGTAANPGAPPPVDFSGKLDATIKFGTQAPPVSPATATPLRVERSIVGGGAP